MIPTHEVQSWLKHLAYSSHRPPFAPWPVSGTVARVSVRRCRLRWEQRSECVRQCQARDSAPQPLS
jgi:hypothetical protein